MAPPVPASSAHAASARTAKGGRSTLVIELKGRFDGDTRLAVRTAAVLAGRSFTDIAT